MRCNSTIGYHDDVDPPAVRDALGPPVTRAIDTFAGKWLCRDPPPI